MDESTRTTKNTLTVLVYASNHTNVLGIPEMRTAKHSLFCFIGLFLFHLSEPGRQNQRNISEGSKHPLPSETLNGLKFSFLTRQVRIELTLAPLIGVSLPLRYCRYDVYC